MRRPASIRVTLIIGETTPHAAQAILRADCIERIFDSQPEKSREKRFVAYDERLAERIRSALADQDGVSERKMFGGVAFMLTNHMFCGIVGTDLMLRLGDDAACTEPHARPMDFTGRPMRGYVYVSLAGLRTAKQLGSWLDRAIGFVRTLPPKRLKTRR